MKLAKLIDFEIKGDSRGSLISLEQYKNVPFDVLRIYYIFDTRTGVSRGFHAHRHLEQVAVCVKGRCQFHLDNGKQKEEIALDSPSVGLYIGHNIWREMHDFSDDCVLLVLASDYYHEDDYIRSYDEFLTSVKNNDSQTK
ncbi:WxcM-like domain-containing protein [Alteromonas sp. 5E99-2]|nr:WxcM-like domain-containing protein [Alteromonas sp. 5E99-2]